MRACALRWVVAFVVAIGMVAQTFAFVRHHGVMLERAFEAEAQARAQTGSAVASLEADLKRFICHSGDENGNAATHAGSGSSDSGTGSRGDCPVCNGFTCAFSLQEFTGLTLPAYSTATDQPFPARDQRIAQHRVIRPPSRGPPATV